MANPRTPSTSSSSILASCRVMFAKVLSWSSFATWRSLGGVVDEPLAQDGVDHSGAIQGICPGGATAIKRIASPASLSPRDK